MPSFISRSYQPELLDGSDIPFEDIRRNMQELDFINTWLGGHAITIAGIKKLLHSQTGNPSKEISICEVGCGGGDNLRAIDNWLCRKNIRANYTGIDINPHCIEYAQSNTRLPKVEWITSDYKDVSFVRKPDIIFNSLFCHHFGEDELSGLFRWMHSNAAIGFFVNDLHRHPLAYHSIKWLTRLFSRSYMVKNDAPLSVLRGFSQKELRYLMQQAGLVNYSIEWKWAFRWLLIVT
jgi:2-polyprenyl-3-methyl-5-hydroxy-6-metoxy-1,4-benzoquinol methylase